MIGRPARWLALGLVILSGSGLAQTADPAGVWNLTFRVGHVGEGLRTIIIEVTREGDRLEALVNGRQNRMVEADEVAFEDGVLRVVYGSYEYTLTIGSDTAEGTVTSPTGTQEVTAARQQSRLFAGDEPPPLEKAWRGDLIEDAGTLQLRTRRATFEFLNALDFTDELIPLVGSYVTISGKWIVDKIEIEQVERTDPPRRR